MQRSRVTCRAAAVSVLGLLWVVTAVFICPETCDCRSNGEVDCNGRGFKDVPVNIPLGSSILRLGDNRIQNLSDTDFSYLTSLEELYLHNNDIRVLPSGVFSHLTSLTLLDLSNNDIRVLPTGVFSNLTSLERLDLYHNDIRALPTQVFSNLTSLEELNLYNNNIRVLPTGVFSNLGSLKRLYLSFNNIRVLPGGVFSHFTHLRGLFLSDNNIADLPDGVFSNLTSLTHLDLRSNNISSLPTGVFSQLTRLTILWLNENHIAHLPNGVFSNLISLERLYLYKNNISSLPIGVFAHLTRLITLYLFDNHIAELPDGVFSQLTSLELLRLKNNNISSLPAGVFSNLTCVVELDLDNNNISTLPTGLFSNLNRLTGLSLSGNHIAEIPDGVFSNLTSLEWLHLGNNNISSLPTGVFSHLNSLQLFKSLYIARNPWRCDCGLHGLMTSARLRTLISDDPTCSSPPHMKGDALSSVVVDTVCRGSGDCATGRAGGICSCNIGWTGLYCDKEREHQPWWKVDLADVYTVSRVTIIDATSEYGICCDNTTKIMNGLINATDGYCFGDHIQFACNPGYELVGTRSSATCEDDGSWGRELPTCQQPTEQSPASIQAIVGSTSAGIATALVVAAVCFVVFLRRRRKKRREDNPQSIEFDFLPDDVTMHRRRMEDIVPLVPPRPQFPKLEVDPSRVTLDQRIGSGAFGLVYRATLTRDDRTEDVVVKTVKDNASEGDKLGFLEEIRSVVDLGAHENLLGLINCCTVVRDHLYLITEFMPYGDLKTFLRKCREEKTYVGRQEDIYNFEVLHMYQVARQIARGMVHQVLQMYQVLQVHEVLQVSHVYQVLQDHIARFRYVHGDLAARNVLVGEHLIVKISDFGLAEDIYSRGYRRQDRLQKIPWKWMAPERLQGGETYTAQSDVWSFGVVLYEICTLGGDPYPDVATSNLKDHLQAGFRMLQPEDCPYAMYDLMLQCWRWQPTERPSFRALEGKIDKNLAFYGPEYATTA
ncbi:uncharacterized protein LOC144879214 [Branchiostoma floridae x Branchiostoma japonicum]